MDTAKGVRNEVFSLTVLEVPHKLAVGKCIMTFIWGYASSLDELWRHVVEVPEMEGH